MSLESSCNYLYINIRGLRFIPIIFKKIHIKAQITFNYLIPRVLDALTYDHLLPHNIINFVALLLGGKLNMDGLSQMLTRFG